MILEIPKNAETILHILENAGYEAYVVGGCVRDSILGRNPDDWDITTSAKPEQVKALFHRTVDTGLQHGTVTVLMEKESYEVTTYRVDGEHVSAERIQVELVKLLMSPHPDYLRVAYEAGITAEFLPEFDACMETPQNTPHHCYTVGEHILHSLCYVRADRVLRITMLLHDIGKPVVRKTDENGRDHFKTHGSAGEKMAGQILRRLKFDNDTIRKVTRLVKWHDDRPEGTTKSVRRAVNRIGEDLFPYYLEVQQADMRAQSDYKRVEKQERLDKVKEAYEIILKEHQCVSLKTLAVTGKDLIEAGYKPGREIGETLNRLLEEVLAAPEKNQKEILLSMLEK